MEKQIEDSFVTYKMAVRLKEMGFNEPCFGIFDYWDKFRLNLNINAAREDRNELFGKSILAPTHEQVIDWILKKHQISVYCRPNTRRSGHYTPVVFHHITGCNSQLTLTKGYENARIRGINNSLEFIKYKLDLSQRELTEMDLQILKRKANELRK